MNAGTAVRERAAPLPSRHRTGWPHDLVLGIRLAVGGGRTSWARLVLGTIGIGLAATVLLGGASIGHIMSSHSARLAAAEPDDKPIAGVAPLRYYYGGMRFRGTNIDGRYLRATGANSPVPPGLTRLPGPDEVVLSPALARLLDSPDGALLRPRFPQRVIGEIGQAGLASPQDIAYFAGVPHGELDTATGPNPLVYGFGPHGEDDQVLSVVLLALVIVGVVALLVPILIMVSVSSRIAGAARDRRLAALRLVGAGTRQVRRIAAAEALVPAATGLLLGAGVFLVLRQLAPRVQILGSGVFSSDVAVSWPLIVVIVVVVPVLAVGSALVALRRTVIEPLGVVRDGRPVRRRLWWRLGLTVVGVALLFLASQVSTQTSRELWVEVVAIGASALLIGVPVLLPYLLERGVSALRGGPPSWQLAIRRLQLDSGTPARVVGGVAVVLAGAIALQTVVMAIAGQLELPTARAQLDTPTTTVFSDSLIGPGDDAAILRTGAVRGVYSSLEVAVAHDPPTQADTDSGAEIAVASCAVIRRMSTATTCADGDLFGWSDVAQPITQGTRLVTVVRSADGTVAREVGRWRVPGTVHLVDPSTRNGGSQPGLLMVTPAAARGLPLPPVSQWFSLVDVDPHKADAIEYVRNAVAAHPLRANVSTISYEPALNDDQKTFEQIRNGLLIGSLFTLALAGISLLVLALEQVRERRRPLAMLSASGVPRGVLARSLLWQIAVPVVLGVVAAIATGIGLAALVLRLTSTVFQLDWADVGLFSGAAAVLVLLVTAATLPALRNATRLSALRTE